MTSKDKKTEAAPASAWATLRQVPAFADGEVDSKNGYNYLKWQAARRLLCDRFPLSRRSYKLFRQADGTERDVMYYADGSASVCCILSVRDDQGAEVAYVEETYPVINYNNKPIGSPNCFQINTARQRAFVKACAMAGLGLHIYEGAEDDSALFEQALVDGDRPVTTRGYLEAFSDALVDLGVTMESVDRFVRGDRGYGIDRVPPDDLHTLLDHIKAYPGMFKK